MPIIENKLITSTSWKPGMEPQDGISMCNGMHWDIRNCIVDLTDAEDGSVDEAIGCTWGSSATFENCVIRGAGKLVLCGCGDEAYVEKEYGKIVTFKNCILENFCRRGPEAQDGMIVILDDCMVFHWGDNDKFDVRAFGAWAHKGGVIKAYNTLFLKGERLSIKHWFQDHWNHFWQCVNERGFFKALFHRDAWLSGYKRALTAGPDGTVYAEHCYSEGLVIDNHTNPMTAREAVEPLNRLVNMKKHLGRELNWDYQGVLDLEAEDYID